MPHRAIADLLAGHRLVVVSNRAPVEVKRGAEGEKFVPTVGGLVSALQPVLKHSGHGLWVAWPGQAATGATDRVELPPDEPCFTLRSVRLSDREVSQYYYGFANRALWPLAHYFVGRCQFRSDQWQAYQRVNERFANVVLDEMQDDDFIWVQDYQLSLVPDRIRRAASAARIGFFWHIPFPEPSTFGILPWRDAVLAGMLGSDVIGFHLESYARNFLACCERFVPGCDVDWLRMTVRLRDRVIRTLACPIGIDADEFAGMATRPDVIERVHRIRRQVGAERIILGVDRLDYTKGILERLRGFERFLETSPSFRGKITFVQIAVPSREQVKEYRNLKREVDEAVGRLSGRFTREGCVPVRYIYEGLPPHELAAYYVAADIALITPLRDGMNLVAKEYVATRVHDDGVLMLSEFAGAAEDLPSNAAVRVNPYNVDDVAEKIERSLTMSAAEVRARMIKLRRHVKERDIFWWLRTFLGEFWGGEFSDGGEAGPARTAARAR